DRAGHDQRRRPHGGPAPRRSDHQPRGDHHHAPGRGEDRHPGGLRGARGGRRGPDRAVPAAALVGRGCVPRPCVGRSRRRDGDRRPHGQHPVPGAGGRGHQRCASPRDPSPRRTVRPSGHGSEHRRPRAGRSAPRRPPAGGV
ncbi:MAG: hypothetical protein AVDCRST_MAG10-264, partial [uncultured Acidimicrobiales bacterium]